MDYRHRFWKVLEVLERYNLARAELAAIERRREEIADISARPWRDVIQLGWLSDPIYIKVMRLARLDEEYDRLRAFVCGVEIALSSLPARERAILEERYLSSPPIPVAELARRNHVSVGGLYAIERHALHRLSRLLGLEDDEAAAGAEKK